MTNAYHLVVLFGSLALLMTLVVRGKSIFVVAPFCALLAITLSGGDPVATMNGAYMAGFADYLRRFYLIFALGAVFGKLMEESGAAITVAQTVGQAWCLHSSSTQRSSPDRLKSPESWEKLSTGRLHKASTQMAMWTHPASRPVPCPKAGAFLPETRHWQT